MKIIFKDFFKINACFIKTIRPLNLALWRFVFIALLATFFCHVNFAHAKAQQSRKLDYIYLIVLENHTLDSGVTHAPAPFLQKLSKEHGSAANYYGVRHPSLPNYIAMIAGDDLGVTQNLPSCFAAGLNLNKNCYRFLGDSLVDQLEAAGLSFSIYSQSQPVGQPLVLRYPESESAALYVQKHNPFVYFEKIATNPSRLARIKSLSALQEDLQKDAPNFAMIVPNQCYDGHGQATCSDPKKLISDYDHFVEETVAQIQKSKIWGARSAIIITFDEGERRSTFFDDQHIALIAVTSCTKASINRDRLDHFSLLATIEDQFGLARLRRSRDAPAFNDLMGGAC